MNKISCEICQDLMPLVKDDVASGDSQRAVLEHVVECEQCATLFEGEALASRPKMNDQRVFAKMRKQLFILAMAMILFGVVVGIGLTESMGVFYNVLIMPTIGIIGYFALRKRVYYLPIGIFIIVYGGQLIRYVLEGLFDVTDWLSLLLTPTFWAVLYSGFCVLGICIGFLLYIAFRREQ